MNIEIKDDVFLGLLKTQVNNIAQKFVSQNVCIRDINKMADELMQKKFNRACDRIINNGSFYDKVAAHLATQISSQISDEIVKRIDVNDVTRLVAENIAERLSKSMAK